MAEQEEGSQADPPPAVQENLERAKTNIKNKADDFSAKTKKSAHDATEAITGQVDNAKAAVEKAAKTAQDALVKRYNDTSERSHPEQDDPETSEKRPNEVAEADDERRKDGLAEDEQGEDSLIELDKDGPTDGEDTEQPDGTVQSKQDTADQAAQPKKSGKERSTDRKPTAKDDTKPGSEAGKADEEWDPEDGHDADVDAVADADADAEAYEVEIDAMLNASEKRAEAELLPDNVS